MIIQDIVLVSRKNTTGCIIKKIIIFYLYIYFDFLFRAITNNNLQEVLKPIGTYFMLNKPIQNDQYRFIGHKNFLY